jgi:HD superfamily phosphodiesterase
MPETTLYRITELHNLAIHAHEAAAAAHAKGDHLTAHELSKQAMEHSMNACKLAGKLAEEGGRPVKPGA